HYAWSRRQGVRAGNLSYHDPMFFRASRLVDRMSSGGLDSRPRILQFIESGTTRCHKNNNPLKEKI
ncbi:MAG: hypothetical protein ABSE84_23430, partial [Isosphaeraceae bacterium]